MKHKLTIERAGRGTRFHCSCGLTNGWIEAGPLKGWRKARKVNRIGHRIHGA